MEGDRRKTERSDANKTARIIHQNLTRVAECIVRNENADGVLLELPHNAVVPMVFYLDISADNMRRPAKVVWRDGNLAGIRFTGPAEQRLGQAS